MMSDYKLFDTIYCALLEFTRSLFQWILGQDDLYVQGITRSFGERCDISKLQYSTVNGIEKFVMRHHKKEL